MWDDTFVCRQEYIGIYRQKPIMADLEMDESKKYGHRWKIAYKEREFIKYGVYIVYYQFFQACKGFQIYHNDTFRWSRYSNWIFCGFNRRHLHLQLILSFAVFAVWMSIFFIIVILADIWFLQEPFFYVYNSRRAGNHVIKNN